MKDLNIQNLKGSKIESEPYSQRSTKNESIKSRSLISVFSPHDECTRDNELELSYGSSDASNYHSANVDQYASNISIEFNEFFEFGKGNANEIDGNGLLISGSCANNLREKEMGKELQFLEFEPDNNCNNSNNSSLNKFKNKPINYIPDILSQALTSEQLHERYFTSAYLNNAIYDFNELTIKEESEINDKSREKEYRKYECLQNLKDIFENTPLESENRNSTSSNPHSVVKDSVSVKRSMQFVDHNDVVYSEEKDQRIDSSNKSVGYEPSIQREGCFTNYIEFSEEKGKNDIEKYGAKENKVVNPRDEGYNLSNTILTNNLSNTMVNYNTTSTNCLMATYLNYGYDDFEHCPTTNNYMHEQTILNESTRQTTTQGCYHPRSNTSNINTQLLTDESTLTPSEEEVYLNSLAYELNAIEEEVKYPLVHPRLGLFYGSYYARESRDGKVKVGDWVCARCANLNYSFRIFCNLCKVAKEGAAMNVYTVSKDWYYFSCGDVFDTNY